MTTTQPDLPGFLLARIRELELLAYAAAEDSGGPTWKLRDHESDPWVITDERGKFVVHGDGSPTEAQAAHIARHDPARVLADCAFKRRIVERFVETAPPYADARQQEIHETLRDEVIEPMARLWADHPAFDPSWRV